MAFAFANSFFAAGAASGTSASIGPQSLTTGNLLVLIIACKPTNLTVSSITDTAGNTYTSCGAGSVNTGNYRTEAFYVKNASGNASNTTTVTMSGTVTDLNLATLQYSGGATGAPFDKASTGNAASGTSLSVTSFTPAASGEMCVAFGIQGATFTAGAGFTLRDQGPGSGTSLGGEDLIGAGAGAQTAPMTSDTSLAWQDVALFFSTVNISGGTTYNESFSGSATASDSATALANFQASVAESATVSDVLTALAVFQSTFSESAAASEAWALSFTVAQAESTSASDSFAAQLISANSFAATASPIVNFSNGTTAKKAKAAWWPWWYRVGPYQKRRII